MGFEELAGELHRNAESEGKKLIGAAEKNAKKAEEEAQQKADELLRNAKKDAHAYAKQESGERLTSAKLAAKKTVDEAKDDAVEGSLHQVWNAFKSASLRKGTYPQLLQKLIAEGMKELGTSEAVIYVRDEDKPLISGYQTAKLPPQHSGGVVLESANGKIRVNKTLEEAFAQKKEGLRKKIYDRLFD